MLKRFAESRWQLPLGAAAVLSIGAAIMSAAAELSLMTGGSPRWIEYILNIVSGRCAGRIDGTALVGHHDGGVDTPRGFVGGPLLLDGKRSSCCDSLSGSYLAGIRYASRCPALAWLRSYPAGA